MPVYGLRPDDVVTDAAGNVQSGVTLTLHATQADATANTGVLASPVVSGGRWSATVANTPVWVRTPDGSVYEIADFAAKADKTYVDGNFSPALNPTTAVADGVANDSAALQAKLNSGAKIIDGLGRSYKINTSVTVPSDVTLRNCKLILGTPGMVGLLMSDRSKALRVHIYGTGTISTSTTPYVERGIAAATDGASDVELDVTVENMTYGIYVQKITSVDPRRWRGKVRAKNIVGKIGTSEGYGVLIAPAHDCNFEIEADNIARHAMYVSAGASGNTLKVRARGTGFSAVAVASYNNQPSCSDNTFDIEASGVRNDPALGAAAFGIHLIGAKRNRVKILLRDSAGAAGAVLLRSNNSDSSGTVSGTVNTTRDNDIDATIYGDVAEYPIISDSSFENTVRVRGVGSTTQQVVLSVRAYNGITAAAITETYTHEMRIRSVDWDANNTAMYATRVNPNTKLVELGGNINVFNSTLASSGLVSDNTGTPSKIVGIGWSEVQQVTSGSIAAGSGGTVTLTFSKKYPIRKLITIGAVSMNGVTGLTDAPQAELVSYNGTTNVATVVVKNNTTAAATATVTVRIEGY